MQFALTCDKFKTRQNYIYTHSKFDGLRVSIFEINSEGQLFSDIKEAQFAFR